MTVIVNGTRVALDAILAVALAALLVVAPMLARLPFATGFGDITFVGGAMTGAVVLALSAALFAASLIRPDPDARALGLMVFSLFVSIALAANLAPALPDHPFVVVYLCAPALFVIATLIPRAFSGAYAWVKTGVLNKEIILALVVLAPVSLCGLALYFTLVQPDLTHQPLMRSGLSPGVWLFAVGLAISALNAAVEEAIYRGVLFHAVEQTLRSPMAALAIQAVAFGAFHFNSNEPGLIGVAITFAFGLALGALRMASRGLAAPFILHFATDIGVWTLGMLQLRA